MCLPCSSFANSIAMSNRMRARWSEKNSFRNFSSVEIDRLQAKALHLRHAHQEKRGVLSNASSRFFVCEKQILDLAFDFVEFVHALFDDLARQCALFSQFRTTNFVAALNADVVQ